MTHQAGAPHDPTYLLGSSPAERERLLAQCDLLRDASRDLLSRLPLPDAAHALDVGCGPLGILDLLGEAVGPHGTVVGLDNDQQMIAWARQSIAERNLANVSTVCGTLPLDGEPRFDLVHCRLLLINNADPQGIVAAMVAATRPGGWIAVQEFDWATWQCDPPHPAWDRLKTLLASVFGGDVHIGARLPALLRAAGAGDGVEIDAYTYYWRARDLYQGLLLHFADIFRERLASLGVTPDHLASLVSALREHLARPGTVVRESLLVQAWARVPARPLQP
ncbi:methyltransferase domain-containing protein [Nonomuraea zeae]|uniref:Methyltransferase domain-containing protein n=1 Tax=Nonomuraea zeae TaxID=1642303 RepID=A0A5S4FU06_9ACTN|nr:methyltransferase domain-containing protein [Nonomuraea zeae]TMR23621.1 methyltransferase domain-containing protein [Nonomuraea zeae]